ncbi:hypothetical protein FACS1894168_4120 [Deltaproteobacteria bacterium]|nr:hypothetical protein FACS1894168_4120 [Deltaproteobacteria bacterium]
MPPSFFPLFALLCWQGKKWGDSMGQFIFYTVIGTLATFAITLHFSVLPQLMQTEAFARGLTMMALLRSWRHLAMIFALCWVAWWGVSGLFSLFLHKQNGLILFVVSLGFIAGIMILVNGFSLRWP